MTDTKDRPTAEEVWNARKRLRMSQTAFAALLGYKGRPATISDWETGKVEPDIPAALFHEKVAEASGLTDGTLATDYARSVLGMLEMDADGIALQAERMLAKIREARELLGGASSPEAVVGTRARAAVAAERQPRAPVAPRQAKGR
jgi:transcriptional regulator with XRE-family HTH domain